MILNAYAVLCAFVAALELFCSLLVAGLGVAAWRAARRPGALTSERREERSVLLSLSAGLLLLLSLASWPLFYLLLQSYVPQWPDVMCIYGVTRVGTGSFGPARFLPRLVTALQVLKPALVFAGGAALTVHLLNRRTKTAPLSSRLFGVLAVMGLLACGDAAATGAYIAIPKKEEFLSVGCCSMAGSLREEAPPDAVTGPGDRPLLSGGYVAANAGMVLALAAFGRRLAGRGPTWALSLLLLGAAAVGVVSGDFLVDVAAPVLLHMPRHHCAYDLLPLYPGVTLGVLLFAGATFAVGWAWVAGRLGRCAETEPFLRRAVARILNLGAWGYFGSLLIMGLELALART